MQPITDSSASSGPPARWEDEAVATVRTARRQPLADAMVDDLLALSRAIVALTARSLAGLGTDLTLPQHRLLVVLAGRGPQRAVDLAGELGVHPSTVTRTCDRLVRRGLVNRYRDDTDRRTVRLGLTATGRDLVGHVMRTRAEEIRRLVEPHLSGGDLLDAMRGVVAALGEPSEAEWWRRWSASAVDARE